MTDSQRSHRNVQRPAKYRRQDRFSDLSDATLKDINFQNKKVKTHSKQANDSAYVNKAKEDSAKMLLKNFETTGN